MQWVSFPMQFFFIIGILSVNPFLIVFRERSIGNDTKCCCTYTKGLVVVRFLSSLRLVHIYTCPRFMFNVWRGTMKSAARVSRSYIAADGDVMIILCREKGIRGRKLLQHICLLAIAKRASLQHTCQQRHRYRKAILQETPKLHHGNQCMQSFFCSRHHQWSSTSLEIGPFMISR